MLARTGQNYPKGISGLPVGDQSKTAARPFKDSHGFTKIQVISSFLASFPAIKKAHSEFTGRRKCAQDLANLAGKAIAGFAGLFTHRMNLRPGAVCSIRCCLVRLFRVGTLVLFCRSAMIRTTTGAMLPAETGFSTQSDDWPMALFSILLRPRFAPDQVKFIRDGSRQSGRGFELRVAVPARSSCSKKKSRVETRDLVFSN